MKLALCIVCLAAQASAGQVIYTRKSPPRTPRPEDLTLTDSVSQYGITWKFDRKVRVGRFVTGDHYVVGPVTVTAITPRPLVGKEVPEKEIGKRERRKRKAEEYVRNGSMLNPPPRKVIAYDSGIKSGDMFDFKLLARPPVKMKPGDSLVSTISLKVGEKVPTPHRERCYREHHDDSPIRTAAVLTCMAGPQPPDAFRPSYCDRGNTIYLARSLRREMLASLPRVKDTPEVGQCVRVFQRPWVNTCWFGFDLPIENMPHYGQHLAEAVSIASLMLMIDLKPEEKEPLLLGVVQAGIDLWGVIHAGHPGWEAWGGHHSGRKPLIVLAGVMLGEEKMASVSKTHPKAAFQEDEQTTYAKCWTGAEVCFAGHSGIQNALGRAARPYWGPYEHKDPAKWDARNFQSEGYRRANTTRSWPGYALALRMLRAEKHFGHDAFFDYVDRWMTEDDTKNLKGLAKAFESWEWRWYRSGDVKKGKRPGGEAKPAKPPFQGRYFRQGQCHPFLKEMWTRYRSSITSE